MKKINLRGISEILSEKELKNVMGGSGTNCTGGYTPCLNKDTCVKSNGGAGTCKMPQATTTCRCE